MTKEEKTAYQNEGINVYSKYLPMPYEQFVEELSIRSNIKYNTDSFSDSELLSLAKMGYENEELETLKPIFVSKMKNVKTTGAIHKETLMSTREYAETKKLVKTVALDSLKVKRIKEEILLKDDEYPDYSIENYYKPKDDRLLYLKLKKHIIENGAYKQGEIEYKPKADGTNGPIVKKVKVYEYASNCVVTPNGGALNDKMHRVDVFKKNGKFYLCPIYMSDVYAKKLPNKVIELSREWSEIDDSFEFLFTLYQNDLIKVASSKEITLSKANKNVKSKKAESISSREIVAYYLGTDISSASIKILSHDGCYTTRGLGVKTLLNIEKLNVDVMGNVFNAPQENRRGL